MNLTSRFHACLSLLIVFIVASAMPSCNTPRSESRNDNSGDLEQRCEESIHRGYGVYIGVVTESIEKKGSLGEDQSRSKLSASDFSVLLSPSKGSQFNVQPGEIITLNPSRVPGDKIILIWGSRGNNLKWTPTGEEEIVSNLARKRGQK